jgi:hypothetical protein
VNENTLVFVVERRHGDEYWVYREIERREGFV